ncbi:MAG TPA: MFS transporter, partial [Solirubrobacteraceae bacterium]|nr:MFS transporter [Solirubrobacteraceae bacterium]
LLAAGIALTAAFVVVEPRRRQPLIELRLFRSRNFSADAFVLGVVQFSLTGVTVFGAIWVQNVLGFSPVTAGLSLLPLTLPLLFLAPAMGRVYDRIGPRLVVTVGCALVAGGLLWNAGVFDQVAYAWLVPSYLAMGAGLALIMTPANTDAMNTAERRLRGEASGVIQTVRQVGGTVGLAIMGTIVAGIQQTKIDAFIASDAGAGPGHAAQIERLLSEAQEGQQSALAQISPEVVASAKTAMTSAVSTAYYVAGGVMLLAAVVSVVVLRRVRAADAPPADRAAAVGPA